MASLFDPSVRCAGKRHPLACDGSNLPCDQCKVCSRRDFREGATLRQREILGEMRVALDAAGMAEAYA